MEIKFNAYDPRELRVIAKALLEIADVRQQAAQEAEARRLQFPVIGAAYAEQAQPAPAEQPAAKRGPGRPKKTPTETAAEAIEKRLDAQPMVDAKAQLLDEEPPEVAGSIEEIAAAAEVAVEQADPTPAESPAATPPAEPSPGAAPAATATASPSEKKVTIEQVRAVLNQKVTEGKRSEINSLIKSYGVNMLTQVPAEKLPEVFEKASAL